MATTRKASRKTSSAVAVAQVGEVTLENIVSATLDATKGFLYTSAAVHTPLAEAGLVEVNPTMANDAGELATRATQKGIDSVSKNGENQTSETNGETAKTEKVKTMFQLEDNVALPSISGRGRTGRGRTGTTYPFEAMAVGQSFFVANSEDKPNAAKSLASTVSSANARYAVPSADGATKTNKRGKTVPVMVETRKFVVRSVEENGVKGARVWRTA
jgi:hypothetical protein